MTLKDKILKELQSDIEGADQPILMTSWEWSLISGALDRYAFSVVEQSVPGKLDWIVRQENGIEIGFFVNQPFVEGFNECRTRTIENARKTIQS